MNDIASVKTLESNILTQLGFGSMTAIQEQAIPFLSQGESVLALAPTGSGKTLGV